MLSSNRDEIIRRVKARFASRYLGRARDDVFDTIRAFIDELVAAEAHAAEDPNAAAPASSSRILGAARYRRGFSIADIIRDYGTVSDVIAELAVEQHVDVDASSYKMLNLSLDNAMASAISEFYALSHEPDHAGVAAWLAGLGHELRNALGGAVMGYSLVKSGKVGFGSATAGVLERSLNRLAGLVAQTLAAVHLRSGQPPRLEHMSVTELVEQVEAGTLRERDITIRVTAEPDLYVRADPDLLEGALVNLVQQAIKCTRDGGTIEVRARGQDDSITVEVEDTCDRHADLAQPTLGLAITRQALEAIGGSLDTREVATGHVFVVQLPRSSA